ncbi:charged multivesicular body protein-like protein 6 [Aureobasidium pullulans EXF-150]|uniref:Charged multivesicular body protein-like protein 6 n=1 Tax=Aureobasidium pullulans EXF-150 TaxID=1043002 RepID=A0A074XCL7_AURPU|nr:charged multivesicular body protein-like protein 6 [Aureobasidium pullulans EXF-150]KEQ83118.1 charged multivesicular body protein-like protein 6 [Aureobasidium pullulans EXF-150]
MGNSSSTPKISAQDRAILDMKNQRDKLHQYQKRITIITNREKEIAKECLRNGDKKRALLALRKKKYQESLLAKTDQQLAQLETLTSDVEFALVQKDVVFGLQQGTKVLKEIHKEMGGLERVELILGENEEAQAYQNEINDMLGTRMTNQEEDEVEDELEALAAEANKQRMPSAAEEGVIAPMPNAPTDAPKETTKERAARRARERETENGAEPILA